MKTYQEQKYSCSIRVRVSWSDGDSIIDWIKGLNPGHALWRAQWNWPGAVIDRV